MALLWEIREVEFLRDKYGAELLVDVDWIDRLDNFDSGGAPHRLWFYDVLLVVAGRGLLHLDEQALAVRPGHLYFTTPGQVRRWDAQGVAGICFFFPADFLAEFFSDPLFLHRLRFFHRHRDSFALAIGAAQERWLVERLERMRDELRDLRSDSPHLLRAVLYEVLVTINRWTAELLARGRGRETSDNGELSPKVLSFLRLLEREPVRLLQVQEVAARLSTTPGHLNALSRKHLGYSASAILQQRVVDEAKRQLLFTDRAAFEVAEALGFSDPSYFGRFFRRVVGESPRGYRDRRRSEGEL